MFKKFNTALFVLFLGIGSCESAEEKTSQQEMAANNVPSSAEKPDGMTLFRQHCVICHGSDGNLGLNGAKHLSESVLPLEERINIITNGKNLMTPFRSQLSPEEIQAVAAYTLTLKK